MFLSVLYTGILQSSIIKVKLKGNYWNEDLYNPFRNDERELSAEKRGRDERVEETE